MSEDNKLQDLLTEQFGGKKTVKSCDGEATEMHPNEKD